jgi:Ca2+-transporting ATPase
VLIVVALLYAWLQWTGVSAEAERTMGFVALVAGNLGLIFAHRAPDAPFTRIFRGENPALWWVVGGAFAALAIVVHWTPLQRLFRFAPVAAHELAASFAIGIAGVVLFAVARVLLSRMTITRKGS